MRGSYRIEGGGGGGKVSSLEMNYFKASVLRERQHHMNRDTGK